MRKETYKGRTPREGAGPEQVASEKPSEELSTALNARERSRKMRTESPRT